MLLSFILILKKKKKKKKLREKVCLVAYTYFAIFCGNLMTFVIKSEKNWWVYRELIVL